MVKQSRVSQSDVNELSTRAGATNSDKTTHSSPESKMAAKLASMPVSYRKRYRREMAGCSLRAGVDSFCSECVNYVRLEVTECNSTLCPLFPHRPFQKKGADDDG